MNRMLEKVTWFVSMLAVACLVLAVLAAPVAAEGPGDPTTDGTGSVGAISYCPLVSCAKQADCGFPYFCFVGSCDCAAWDYCPGTTGTCCQC